MPDLTNDPIKDASEGFWARINHPVIGVFITSVVIWNWEIFFYIIRGLDTPQNTVAFVNKNFLNQGNFGNLIIVPAVLTALYLVSAPALHEAYSVYKIWWNGVATKQKPLFKFQYEKVYEDYKKQIIEKENIIKNEKKICLNDKTKLEATISDLSTQNEFLNGARQIDRGGRFNVPGYKQFDSSYQLLIEFSNNRARVAELDRANGQLQGQIGDKLVEIKRLNGEVADLKSKIPPQ
jgi:hypothetical protein